jgi:hypothetical protein
MALEAERYAGGDLQILSLSSISKNDRVAEADDRVTHVKAQSDVPRRI